MTIQIAHVTIPDSYRAPDGSLAMPGVERIPFGHSRLDGGGVVFAELEAGRPLLGTVEFGRSGDPGEAPSLDGVRDAMRRLVGADLPIGAPQGPGPHALRRIDGQNTRLAAAYRAGTVLLVGDAAHVHSAMGGPGLNLGLQDAVNLGWKLAAAVSGWAPPGLRDTYFTERHPVGERVMMQSMAQTALMASGPEVTALRGMLAEMFEIPAVATYMAKLLAGSDVRYDTGDDHPLSGLLVPDWTLTTGQRVAELFHRARPVLLDADGSFGDVLDPWRDRVDVVRSGCPEAPRAVLIRPDGYVVWAAGSADGLRAAAARWFG